MRPLGGRVPYQSEFFSGSGTRRPLGSTIGVLHSALARLPFRLGYDAESVNDEVSVPMSERFELVSSFEPKGDQPAAIAKLTDAFRGGARYQCLLGVRDGK